jgi:integrase
MGRHKEWLSPGSEHVAFRDLAVGKPETVLNACLPCCKEAIADIAMRRLIFEIRHGSGAKQKVAPAIRPWTLHDLRRSFASGLQRLGVAPHIVELALNHRSGTFSGVAGIYQRHRYAKEVAEAFAVWSRHIETLTTQSAVAA